MSFFTYIVRCRDGTLYTGWTNDLEERVRNHNRGRGGRYTRSRMPVELAYFEEHLSKSEAMSREQTIKKMPRAKKELLTKSAWPAR